MENNKQITESKKKKKKKKGGLKFTLNTGGEMVTVGETRQKFAEWIKEREKKDAK